MLALCNGVVLWWYREVVTLFAIKSLFGSRISSLHTSSGVHYRESCWGEEFTTTAAAAATLCTGLLLIDGCVLGPEFHVFVAVYNVACTAQPHANIHLPSPTAAAAAAGARRRLCRKNVINVQMFSSYGGGISDDVAVCTTPVQIITRLL